MGIYLDNAATSYPKPNQVAKSIYEFMINNGTSSGSCLLYTSDAADEGVEV